MRKQSFFLLLFFVKIGRDAENIENKIVAQKMKNEL